MTQEIDAAKGPTTAGPQQSDLFGGGELAKMLATEEGQEEHSRVLATLAERKEAALAKIETKRTVLVALTEGAVRLTYPGDWVANKDAEGHEWASLKVGGAQRIAQLWGVHLFNLRGPNEKEVAQAVLIAEDDGSKTAVLIGDVFCETTGATFQGVRAARNSKEKFAGRPRDKEMRGHVGEACSDQDLRSACYSLLFNKGVGMATGCRKVPVSFLVNRCKFDPDAIPKGHGYRDGGGTSEQAEGCINQNQSRRLYAKYQDKAKELGMDWQKVRDAMFARFADVFGRSIKTDKEIKRGEYDRACGIVDGMQVNGASDDAPGPPAGGPDAAGHSDDDSNGDVRKINAAEGKKLFALYKSRASEIGCDWKEIRDGALRAFGLKSDKQLPIDRFDDFATYISQSMG